jgi:hypothetical protein
LGGVNVSPDEGLVHSDQRSDAPEYLVKYSGDRGVEGAGESVPAEADRCPQIATYLERIADGNPLQYVLPASLNLDKCQNVLKLM